MAEIDPNIALSYRPPNLATMPNLQIQTPLESLARVVSLRSLMQEGQLKGLQLQQLKQQIQEQQNISDLMKAMYGVTTGAGSPGGPVAPVPVAPVQPSVPAPPAAPLAGGAPVTPTGVDVTAGLDRYLTAPGPTPAPQDVAPAPQPPTVSAAQLMAPTTTQQAPQFAAPGAPPGWPAQYPTPAQIMRAAPISGPAVIKQLTDQQKDLLDLHIKNQTEQKNQIEDMVRLANGSQDNESFQRNMVEAANKGYISSNDARRYTALGFDDPKTQAWLQSSRMQLVSADKQQEMKLALAKDAREGAMFYPQYAKAQEDRKQAARVSAAQSIGDLQDKNELSGWMAKQDPTIIQSYGQYLNSNLPLEQIKKIIELGAGGSQKATEAAATTTATEAAKQAEQIRQDEPLIQGILTGKYSLQDQPPATQERIGPELARRQAAGTITAPPEPGVPVAAPVTGAPAPGAPPTPAPSPGTAAGTPAGGGAPAPAPFQFGKRPSDEETKRLSDLQRAWTIANELQKKIREPQSIDLMGPVAGLRSLSPYASATNSLKDYLGSAQQALKKFQTQGSLRGFTEKQLDEMSPTIYTHPDEANQQVVNMKNTITAEYEQLVKDLEGAGKVVPQALIPKTGPAPQAAPAPAPAPPKQPQAAPAKVPADVPKQLNRGAGKYTLPDGRVFYKKKDGTIVAGQ